VRGGEKENEQRARCSERERVREGARDRRSALLFPFVDRRVNALREIAPTRTLFEAPQIKACQQRIDSIFMQSSWSCPRLPLGLISKDLLGLLVLGPAARSLLLLSTFFSIWISSNELAVSTTRNTRQRYHTRHQQTNKPTSAREGGKKQKESDLPESNQ